MRDFARHIARLFGGWAVSCALVAVMPRTWWPTVANGAFVLVAASAVAMLVMIVRDVRRERTEKPVSERMAETTALLERLRHGREEYLVAMVEIRAREADLGALVRKAGRHDEADLHDAEVRAIDRYLAVAHGVARSSGGDA